MSASAERLNRYLARRGVASRRSADALIVAGRVAIEGRRASLGERVLPGQVVTVDGRPVNEPVLPRTLALHKPVGVVTTRHDPRGRPTVVDLLPDPVGLVPVGRLDVDTWGLLLVSSDGDLTFRLTHPRFAVEKVYRVSVLGRAEPEALERLVDGVVLDDGPARVVRLRSVGRWAKGDVLEVVMTEGRRREVRRLFAAIGLPVADLGRISVGPVHLGHLPVGASRPLRRGELRALYASVGLQPPPEVAGDSRGAPA